MGLRYGGRYGDIGGDVGLGYGAELWGCGMRESIVPLRVVLEHPQPHRSCLFYTGTSSLKLFKERLRKESRETT